MAQKTKNAAKVAPSKSVAKKAKAQKAVVKPKSAPKAVKAAKASPAAPVAVKGRKVTPANIAKAKQALKKARPEAAAKPMRTRKISVDVDPNEATSALAQKWSTLFKKSQQIESKPYNMKSSFEEKTAIVHKILGWGYILANRNDRLEVLFKDGIRYLISNYKP